MVKRILPDNFNKGKYREKAREVGPFDKLRTGETSETGDGGHGARRQTTEGRRQRSEEGRQVG